MPISVESWENSNIFTGIKKTRGTAAAPKPKRPDGCTIDKKDVIFYPCPFGKPHLDCIGDGCSFMDKGGLKHE